MHRKRGSLEQGLMVTPSPSFSRSDFGGFRAPLKNPNRPLLPDPDSTCIARVPLCSLAAFLLCTSGVALFTTMAVWAFNASVEQARRALRVHDLPWLDKVQLLFIISACAMVAIALAFLCIGVLSTGPTRASVFGARAEDARRGGRASCILAICMSALLNLLWTIIAMLAAILGFIYTVLFALCSTPSASAGDGCLDFGLFESLLRGHTNASLKLCDGELQQFCAVTSTVIVWYFVGLLGALIVCTGLVQFIACNASNYAHIVNESKYAELCDVLQAETMAMGMPMSQFSTDQQQFVHRPHHHHRQQNFDHHYEHAPIYQPQRPRQHQQQQFDCYRPNKPDKRSVGAVVGSARRNSYQHSLHGSNSWLNQQDHDRAMY